MSDLARLRERLRQNRAARRQTITDTPRPASSRHESGARALAPGDRVFDRVNGEEGDIVSITRENILVPTAERRDR